MAQPRARGTTTYAKPKGTNNSVRGNRLSAKPTPSKSKSAVNTRQGSRVGSKPSASSQVSLQTRTGTYVKGRSGVIKSTTFQAPSDMPTKLNNTAARAISAQRQRTGMLVAAYAIPVPLNAALGGMLGFKAAIGGAALIDGYSTVRLKASGYKVAKTGFGSQIKYASPRSQRRAQAKSTKRGGFGIKSPKGGKGSGRGRRTRRDSRGRYAGSY